MKNKPSPSKKGIQGEGKREKRGKLSLIPLWERKTSKGEEQMKRNERKKDRPAEKNNLPINKVSINRKWKVGKIPTCSLLGGLSAISGRGAGS